METFYRVLITSGRGTQYQTEMPFDLIETTTDGLIVRDAYGKEYIVNPSIDNYQILPPADGQNRAGVI